MKLRCLQMIFADHIKLNMVGDYNYCKPRLITEKLAGGTLSCIGFVHNNINQFLVPNTLLKDDIRQITNNGKIVLAVFRKHIRSSTYDECVYRAKDSNLAKALLDEYRVPLILDGTHL